MAAAAALAAAIAFGGPPAAAAPDLTVTLLPQVVAQRPVVRLDDCAVLAGSVPTGLGGTALAAAPAAGQREVISRGQIAAVLTAMGAPGVDWSGADACVVTTPAQTISGDQLVGAAAKAIEAALPAPGPGAAYVVTPMAETAPALVPARPFSLVATPPPTLGLGIVTVGVRIMEDGTLVRTAVVPLEVGLRGPVVVTVDALPYHTALGPQSVRVDVRTSTVPGGRSFQDPAAVTRMWTTQAIPAGTVLTPDMVAPMPAVQRGAMVTVVVQRGSLWISAIGQAQDDAVIGQLVSVKIQSTGVTVSGVVTAPDTVELGAP